jgi:predicted nucleic acid-binding protein
VIFSVDSSILLWDLGGGESEVLSWALAKPGCIAVLDDLAARRCSTALGIRHIGTAGLLVLASRFKLIPSLEEAFHEVRKAGLYLKDDLVQRLLAHESS